MFKRPLSLSVIVCFFLTSLTPYQVHADTISNLPAPGTMVNLSPAYQPVIIKGLTIHKDNPFLFDFIVDVGQDNMSGESLKREGNKLIKYFLASLAIPDRDMWVNLSPYEKSKMIPEALGQTDMGRDLLEQDYVLKQITASLIYPEKQLGKAFWNRVYAKSQEMYGTTQVPVNTFNKVWIMADKAEVFEHNQTAFVVNSHLKVMLEEDYLALQKHSADPASSFPNVSVGNPAKSNTIGSQIVKAIILPELEKEVNTGKNFSNLRQIFNSIILSSWYKRNLKEALLNQVYANKSKINGINLNDPTIKQQIYEQYLKAYRKGVFNYIKDDVNNAGETIPRKYFSGGMAEGAAADPAMTTDLAALANSLPTDRAMVDINAGIVTNSISDLAMSAGDQTYDAKNMGINQLIADHTAALKDLATLQNQPDENGDAINAANALISTMETELRERSYGSRIGSLKAAVYLRLNDAQKMAAAEAEIAGIFKDYSKDQLANALNRAYQAIIRLHAVKLHRDDYGYITRIAELDKEIKVLGQILTANYGYGVEDLNAIHQRAQAEVQVEKPAGVSDEIQYDAKNTSLHQLTVDYQTTLFDLSALQGQPDENKTAIEIAKALISTIESEFEVRGYGNRIGSLKASVYLRLNDAQKIAAAKAEITEIFNGYSKDQLVEALNKDYQARIRLGAVKLHRDREYISNIVEVDKEIKVLEQMLTANYGYGAADLDAILQKAKVNVQKPEDKAMLSFRNDAKIGDVRAAYGDVLSQKVLDVLGHLAPLTEKLDQLRKKRDLLYVDRQINKKKIGFLPTVNPDGTDALVPGTDITVKDARSGNFDGDAVPADLQRQWIQLTGPAAKSPQDIPAGLSNREVQKLHLRNIFYALTSGADGMMFDGEDALGQLDNMSLDNVRALVEAYKKTPLFWETAEQVAQEMIKQGKKPADWNWRELIEKNFTTRIYRVRGMHLDDRHINFETSDGRQLPVSATVVDMTTYLVNAGPVLIEQGSTPTLYLPKLQTAEEAAWMASIIDSIEDQMGWQRGTVKVFVLIEQLEEAFQLMEIRAALGKHFVGFNTGRWDYIADVVKQNMFNNGWIPPNFKEMTMTYPFMYNYEGRVLRAVNTPDRNGNKVLWIGGMEPQIPVVKGQISEADKNTAIENAMRIAEQSKLRELKRGASGTWVAHPGMVERLRKVYETNLFDATGKLNQIGIKENSVGDEIDALKYDQNAADDLIQLKPGERTIAEARFLISVALQYANAYLTGRAAAALKGADLFIDPSKLFIMEDMATGEGRSKLTMKWMKSHALITDITDEDKQSLGIDAGARFSPELIRTIIQQEYAKLQNAPNDIVFASSKTQELPIANMIVEKFLLSETPVPLPWLVDLTNMALGAKDLQDATDKVDNYIATYVRSGGSIRLTSNPDNTSSDAAMLTLEDRTKAVQARWDAQRKSGRHIVRLYGPEKVAELMAPVNNSLDVQNHVAQKFWDRLVGHYISRTAINTFGPFDENQAEAMARAGIEAFYVGGWAESQRDGVPDTARYPYTYISDWTARMSRHLLQSARKQEEARSKMSPEERAKTPAVDFLVPLFVDIDTGHEAPAEMIERIMTAGFDPQLIAAVHIEDQAHGAKKCGHMAGKVLVSTQAHIERLRKVRYQLDLMGLDTLIVARTDAEAAEFITSNMDKRDHPFILGATVSVPTYDSVIDEANAKGLGDLELSKVSKEWKSKAHLKTISDAVADLMVEHQDTMVFKMSVEEWREFAKTASHNDAVKKAQELGITILNADQWNERLTQNPESLNHGLNIFWDWDLPKVEDSGRVLWMIQSGTEMAKARSQAFMPYADIAWMEQHHPDISQVKEWAGAIDEAALKYTQDYVIPQLRVNDHEAILSLLREYVEHKISLDIAKQSLMDQHKLTEDQANDLLSSVTRIKANNTSPSFYWPVQHERDVPDDELASFLPEQGKYIQFNFITYAGTELAHFGMQQFLEGPLGFLKRGMAAWGAVQKAAIAAGNPFVKNSQKHAGTVYQSKKDATPKGAGTVASALGEKDTMSQFGAAAKKDHAMTTPGGIDLSTSNGMQWKVSKDGKGVEMDVDPAMVARIERDGFNWLSPVIFKMTPVSSIWPLVGLQAPAQQEVAGV